LVDEPNRLPGSLNRIDPRKEDLITMQHPF
jgi:hypothetical protein